MGGIGYTSTAKTDTNGDGVVDDKDKSLLEQGVGEATGILGKVADGVGGAAGAAAGGVANAVLDGVKSMFTGVLEGMGIDVEKAKQYFYYFIIFIVVCLALVVIGKISSIIKFIRSFFR